MVYKRIFKIFLVNYSENDPWVFIKVSKLGYGIRSMITLAVLVLLEINK